MFIHKKRNSRISTYLKYIFSYFLIMAILFFGFFLILKHEITQRFVVQNNRELESRLENIQGWFYDNYVHLNLMTESFDKSIALTKASWLRTPSRQYNLFQEMDQ